MHGGLSRAGTALLLLAGGAAVAADRRPNVVVVSVCSLRADRLSSYGYRHATTPAIDRLAADGVLFEQAVSVASWSRPSMMSVMTGLLPERHEVRDRGPESVLPSERPMLAERLREAGYRTAVANTSTDLQRHVGFYRGFEGADCNPGSDGEYPVTEHIDLPWDGEERLAEIQRRYVGAVEWARRHRDVPFFLWVADFGQHNVPHWGFASTRDGRALAVRRWPGRMPLPAPRGGPRTGKEPLFWTEGYADYPWSRDELDVLYDTALVCTDDRVGTFLDALRREGLYDSTLVILLADHGEGLLDRGTFGHFGSPYDELVRVPLIVKRPGGASAGRRVKEPVGTVDVTPTVLREVGVPVPGGLDGRPLQGYWEGRPDRRDVCVQVDHPERGFRAVRTDDGWKIIVNRATGTLEVYHVAEDPGERVNLAVSDTDRTDTLYGRLTPCMSE
jgi:arylsulfatase A-like enzyme